MYVGKHRHRHRHRHGHRHRHKSPLPLPHITLKRNFTAAKHCICTNGVPRCESTRVSLALSPSLSLALFVCVYLGAGLRECVMMLFMSSYVSTSSSPSAHIICTFDEQLHRCTYCGARGGTKAERKQESASKRARAARTGAARRRAWNTNTAVHDKERIRLWSVIRN